MLRQYQPSAIHPHRRSLQTKTKTVSVLMTLVRNSIGDAERSHPRQRLPLNPFERNASTFTAPAVRRLQAIQSPAGPGRRSFACLFRREGDPECKVGQDIRVGPRHSRLTPRIASAQAAGQTRLSERYLRRVDEVIVRHVR